MAKKQHQVDRAERTHEIRIPRKESPTVSNAQTYALDLQQTCQELQAVQNGTLTIDNKQLYTKLGELARFIDETMRKLGELEQPLNSSTNHLPQASDALLDLTRMTEEGTMKVMELTEGLMDRHKAFHAGLEAIQIALAKQGKVTLVAQVAALADLSAPNQKALMDIVTTLSFQDLVGQRIKKVVGIIEEVQARLLELVVVFGRKAGPPEEDGGRAVVLLKELEQTKKTSIKQDVVDDLLKEFGF